MATTVSIKATDMMALMGIQVFHVSNDSSELTPHVISDEPFTITED